MEVKMSALIVDDEDNARKLLHKLLEETMYFGEIKSASSVNSAITKLTQFEPDLIFLDIEMPGKDGFSFIHDFSRGKNNSCIIFVTAYDQYAIKAIKNGAFDYLLKPVDRAELKQCIVRYSETIKERQNVIRQYKTPGYQEKIPRIKVASRSGTLFINPSSILYCKADGNYTSICTGSKKHLCSMNIGKIEKLLSGNGFIRLGRSLIVNFGYITLLNRKECILTMVRDNESVNVKIPKHHLKNIDMV
jgi:two-component system LytT family response regulator